MKKPNTRDAMVIQRAHDILTAIATGEVPYPMDATRLALHASLDALCWVLGHDHNTAFAENLARLEADIEAQGFQLRKTS